MRSRRARPTRARPRPAGPCSSRPPRTSWKRTAVTPPIAILYEEARPGRVYHCKNPKIGTFLHAGGTLLTWQPRPEIAKRLYWRAAPSGGVLPEGSVSAAKQAPVDNSLAPGETASQTIRLPPGH